MGAFSLPLPSPTQTGQGNFQLGQGQSRAGGALPVGSAPGLAQSLQGGGGGLDLGALLGLIQSVRPPAAGQAFAGDLGLVGPVAGAPPRSRTGGSPRPRSSGVPLSGAEFSRNPLPPFDQSFEGNTTNRAQAIADLVGGQVGSFGNIQTPANQSDTQFNRSDATILVGGREIPFTQLENALVNRGVAGLANTLALEGGITNEFTNEFATAGSFGKF